MSDSVEQTSTEEQVGGADALDTPALAPSPEGVIEVSVPDTLISLIVAFVIAMAFRGFVLEGFVIPTGSMAPTLLGDHALWTAPGTGYTFATDMSGRDFDDDPVQLSDPMLSRRGVYGQHGVAELATRRRAGDRVLVLKWLYNIFDPNRWDVIVFRNPTIATENYIKRLIGLPNEEIWIADGDVFTRPAGSDERFAIARKPEHVQRAVWQPVHDMRYAPPDASMQTDGPPDPHHDVPWTSEQFTLHQRYAFRADGTESASLRWNSRVRHLDDFNAFNMLRQQAVLQPPFNTGDLRVAAAITPDSPGLAASLELVAHEHVFLFSLNENEASLRMRKVGDERWAAEVAGEISALRPGRPTNVDLWHVDQRMVMFVNGEQTLELRYDWSPRQRLLHATGVTVARAVEESHPVHPWTRDVRPAEAALEWSFSGAAVTVHRLRVDRDLYYRPISRGGRPGLGTHPERTAVTDADQFFMLGDNSASSKDSRIWGEPDHLVAEQIDDTPNLVNRDLIVGKAWFVYFPSPSALREGGTRFVPDFGRLRFIR